MYSRRCILLILLFTRITTSAVVVKVKQGTLIGAKRSTVFEGKRFFAFYRIPYAQPPIKKLRFKNPVAPKKWKLYLDASMEYHGACAQAHIVHKQGLYGNEDCLYLNVYTPNIKDTDGLKPVIVWIHGYAFTSSFSHVHGPDFIIDKDVLLVTVAHRIGPFGFLKVNVTDSHANMGLKDIMMALKWIRRNIKSFGGDKKRVTVMGSGSAATFLSWLLMTKARVLFSKAILQSGSLFAPSLITRDANSELERLTKVLNKLGVEKLTNASTENIISASQKIYNTLDFVNYQRPLVPFAPVREIKSKESLITFLPDELFKRRKLNNSMPILVGYNSQESISEVIPFLQNPAYLNMFSGAFKFMVPFFDGCRYNYTTKIYNDIGVKIKNKYFRDGISEKSVPEFVTYISDLYKYPLYKFIDTISKWKLNKIFMYKFNFVGAFNSVRNTALQGAKIAIKGAATGDEICYLLKCEPMWEHYMSLKEGNDTNNKNMIKEMTEWWTNFAKFGDPTPALRSSYQWPTITTFEENNVMLIGRDTKLAQPRYDIKAYYFWNKIYDNYYRNEHCERKTRDEL